MHLGALLIATACWGSTVVTIKIASRGLPILTLSLLEVATALLALCVLLGVRRTRLYRPSWSTVVAGVLEPGLTYPLINAGFHRTSGTHGAVIVGLESVLIVVVGALLARARPSRRILTAVTVSVIGAALVSGHDSGTATLSGDLLVVAGVVTATGYVLVTQRSGQGQDAVAATFYQFLFGGLALAPVMLLAGHGRLWGHPSAGQVAAAVTAGVLGSAVAFCLYNWALSRISTALAGTSLTLIPVFGIAFSFGFLHESVSVLTLIAAGAVLAGVVLATKPANPARDAVTSAAASREA